MIIDFRVEIVGGREADVEAFIVKGYDEGIFWSDVAFPLQQPLPFSSRLEESDYQALVRLANTHNVTIAPRR